MNKNEYNYRFLITFAITIVIAVVLTILVGISPTTIINGTTSVVDSNTVSEKYEEGTTTTYQEFIENPPEFDGENMIVTVNQNRPFFTKEDKELTDTFISYSDFDENGRVGLAIGNLEYSLHPTEARKGDLSTITPPGWVQCNTEKKYNVKLSYGDETDTYLWARCHLIAYTLGGGELEAKGIFTGTFSCNQAMLQIELKVLDFLETCQNEHVLYRITPIYRNDEDLIPCGVLMEGYSIEAEGLFINFCQYIHNAQPGFEIDYSTGEETYIG